MKKSFTLLALVLSGITMIAQPTITSDDLPKPGKSYQLGYDTVENVSITPADSTSQTWNFAALGLHYFKYATFSPTAPHHQYMTDFQDASMYTYGPSFMFGGLFGGAPVDMNDWGYLYWSSDMAGFQIVGFRGDYGIGDINVLEEEKELLMGVPATYSSTFTDSARWHIDQAFYQGTWPNIDVDTHYISTVQKTLSCDAFGSLTTPFGTYDVLRVHEYFIGIDSLKASYLGVMVDSLAYVTNDTLNNYYFWAAGVGYPIATIHADKNNNIIDVEYIYSINECDVISGKIFEPDASTPVVDATVNLIARSAWDHLFGIPETVTVDNSGNYQFSCVVGANWLVRANPDFATYPNYFSTYYNNVPVWENATTLSVTSDTTIDITVIEDSSSVYQTWNGILSGTIWQDSMTLKTNDVRAGNVRVTLVRDPGGAAVIPNQSDENGDYDFTNLTPGNYWLKVEVPGILMDSTYHITIDSNNSTFTGLDFKFDTAMAYVIGNVLVEETINRRIPVSVYPIPATDAISIQFDCDGYGEYEYSIFDIQGRKIKVYKGMSSGTIKITSLDFPSGYYLYSLSFENEAISEGKLVVTGR